MAVRTAIDRATENSTIALGAAFYALYNPLHPSVLRSDRARGYLRSSAQALREALELTEELEQAIDE